MASVKLYLDTRTPRKDGTFPLKLAITHKGKFFINLKIYLTEDQLEGEEIINHKSKKIYNPIIQQRLVDVKKILLTLDADGKLSRLSSNKLKELIENPSETNDDVVLPYLFKDHFVKFIVNKKKKNTKETYQYTFNKISEFTNIDTLTFQDMNLSWMKRFEIHLSELCAVNTRGILFRNIRSIFNDAIDDELISPNIYPFRKFKIDKETTLKRSLTVDELILLRDYPCEEHQEKYRDIFMLIFYLIGINTVDIFNLKEIRNGNIIEYRRAKTNRLYTIEVLPEAQTIIDKYRGENYLINILDRYSNYRDFAHRLNDNLQEIGEVKLVEKTIKGKKRKVKERKPILPDLTTYYARHTWATIAASLDIPKETIAAALGHGGNSVTDIYINFDQKKINEANRRVVDHLKKSTSK